MLLADQVEVLRRNLPEIREIKCALPLRGGYRDTRTAYRFVYLVHPARDIITTIMKADGSGSTLPRHLRGWNIDAKDGQGARIREHLKRILNMIVHMHYLRVDEVLDVSNDSNEKRRIIPRDVFSEEIGRLVLTNEDIGLVACALAEKTCSGGAKEPRPTSPRNPEAPGCRDLQRILWDIGSWPELKEIIWNEYFQCSEKMIESDSKILNDVPFVKETHSSTSKATCTWRMGWRRDVTYSDVWIDVLHMIATIRDYMQKV